MWDWITGAAGSVLSAISGLIGWVWKLILLYIVRKQAKVQCGRRSGKMPSRQSKSSATLRISLSFAVMLFLTACSSGNVQTSTCPSPVWADEKVGEELENIPFDGFEDLWDWIAQVERLNEQLQACYK